MVSMGANNFRNDVYLDSNVFAYNLLTHTDFTPMHCTKKLLTKKKQEILTNQKFQKKI
jgi:hypothetical protein